MLEVLNILMLLPLFLEQAVGDNRGFNIVDMICVLELFVIVWLIIFLFTGKYQKNSDYAFQKIRDERDSIKKERDDLKEEKNIAERDRDNYKTLYENREDVIKELNESLIAKGNDIQQLQAALNAVKQNENNKQSTDIDNSPINPQQPSVHNKSNGVEDSGPRLGFPSEGDEGDGEDKKTEPKEQQTKETFIRKKLYASSYDKDKKTFYTISPVPIDNTIYVMSFMTESDTEAELNIFSGATEIIMACRDYLEICCDTIGHGNELKVEKPGLVVLENGKWSIKKKVMVKFF